MSGVNVFIEDYLPSKKESVNTVPTVSINDYLPKVDGKVTNNINVNEVPLGDAKSYFDGDFEIINRKWKVLGKLFKKKNMSRKECILLPFKTLKKIVSD